MALVNEFSNRINDGWDMIRQNAISKLEAYLNTGNSEVMFTRKEYMQYYTYGIYTYHTLNSNIRFTY